MTLVNNFFNLWYGPWGGGLNPLTSLRKYATGSIHSNDVVISVVQR